MAVSGPAKEIIEPGLREKRIGEDGEYTYRRKWLVTVTEPDDDPNIAQTASGIPQRYFPYVTASSVDMKALVTELTVTQANSPYHYFVEAIYSTQSGDPLEEQDNPLAEPADIDWSFETIQQPIIGTPDQNISIIGSTAFLSGAVKSPAGEVYNPPPMMDESRPVVTVTRNEASYSVQNAVLYQNAVNSDVFFGVPARCAKMRGISASKETRKGITFWRVTYTIAFKRDTWDLYQLNFGTVYLAASTDTSPTQFKTTDGFPTIGFLNTDGTQRGSTLTPTFTGYRIHKELPFGALSLPLGP